MGSIGVGVGGVGGTGGVGAVGVEVGGTGVGVGGTGVAVGVEIGGTGVGVGGTGSLTVKANGLRRSTCTFAVEDSKSTIVSNSFHAPSR